MRIERVIMLSTDDPVAVVRRPGLGPVVLLNAARVTEAAAARFEQRLRADRTLLDLFPSA
ncbi:hypothetical protein F4556_005216 [Kitasatospora gansuensis]|uniref:Uncharacterized protein n=2 Tax=Kitasatospora TaxID=2063 RepID=A0A7W7WJV0_9ACTN|nr:hypothetical protein [Kitasatospora gansuensis]MBB4949681.1 hypothetical protein [Kitasatospora gansuensis]